MQSLDPDQYPTVWRTKLRSTKDGVNHEAQVAHCLDNDLIGIGWDVGQLKAESTIDQVCEAIDKNPAYGKNATYNPRRFAEQAKKGDFVWTRDTKGRYLLCQITGEYRYDGSETARKVDIHQTREVQWAPSELDDLDVPGGVVRRFIGAGLSFSRINDRSVRILTPYLWDKLHGKPLPKLEITPMDVLTKHLDPLDVEDLIYVWLQHERGYISFPRARTNSNPVYEWTMIHPSSGRKAILQVKTGNTPVDLDQLGSARINVDTDVLAFATCGTYNGSFQAEQIDAEILISFVRDNPNLLPERIRNWFDMAT